MNIRYAQRGLAHMGLIAVTLFVVAGALGGFLLLQARTQHASQATASREALPTDLSGTLSLEKLKEFALADKPHTGITNVQLKQEKGVLVYKVSLRDGTTVAFNAKTGTPVNLPDAASTSSREQLPETFTATISFDEARTIAAKEHDVTITSIEMETTDGLVAYIIRFVDGMRIDINASNGTIARKEAPKDPNLSGQTQPFEPKAEAPNANDSSTTQPADTTEEPAAPPPDTPPEEREGEPTP